MIYHLQTFVISHHHLWLVSKIFNFDFIDIQKSKHILTWIIASINLDLWIIIYNKISENIFIFLMIYNSSSQEFKIISCLIDFFLRFNLWCHHVFELICDNFHKLPSNLHHIIFINPRKINSSHIKYDDKWLRFKWYRPSRSHDYRFNEWDKIFRVFWKKFDDDV